MKNCRNVDNRFCQAEPAHSSFREEHRRCNPTHHFEATWESLQKYIDPRMVPGRQVWHFHPLGAVRRARPLATNGTRAICISRARPSSSTTSRPMGRRASSATRISSPCSRPRTMTRQPGRTCSSRPGRSSSCRSPNIMTASPCTTRSRSAWTAAKMGPKRDLIGELAEAVRAKRAWCLASPATARSTGSL